MNNFKKCIFLPFIALCSFHTYAANSPLTQELKAQANEYIKDHRVSLQEAQKRLAIQDAKAPLIEQIKQKYKERLAGIYVEHDPTYKTI